MSPIHSVGTCSLGIQTHVAKGTNERIQSAGMGSTTQNSCHGLEGKLMKSKPGGAQYISLEWLELSGQGIRRYYRPIGNSSCVQFATAHPSCDFFAELCAQDSSFSKGVC